MRVLCEMRVLDLVIETRMQQGILGFVKLNYCNVPIFALLTAVYNGIAILVKS